VSVDHGWDETNLSGQKLENSDLIRVGPCGYNPHGSGRVGQGPILMGHGGWDGRVWVAGLGGFIAGESGAGERGSQMRARWVRAGNG
jgi:hypothetical protein